MLHRITYKAASRRLSRRSVGTLDQFGHHWNPFIRFTVEEFTERRKRAVVIWLEQSLVGQERQIPFIAARPIAERQLFDGRVARLRRQAARGGYCYQPLAILSGADLFFS